MNKKIISYVLALAMLVHTLAMWPGLSVEAAENIRLTTNGVTYNYYDMEVSEEQFETSPATFLRTALTKARPGSTIPPISNWGKIAFAIERQIGEKSNNSKDNVDLNYAITKVVDKMYEPPYMDGFDLENLDTDNEDDDVEGAEGNTYLGYYSGLKNATSLKNAQESGDSSILELIKKYYEEAGGSQDDIKNVAKAVDELNDETEQQVFYQVFGAFKSSGGGKSGHYRAYAVVYDNFQVSPIIDPENMMEGLSETVIGDPKTTPDSYSTGLRNNTAGEATVEQSLSSTSTKSVTSEINGSNSYEFGQSITTSVGFSVGSLFDASVEIGVTASQAIEKGWAQGESFEESTSQTSSASMILPPYTSAIITQSTTTQDMSTKYQCPVAVSYDVTIASYMKDPNSNSRIASGYCTSFTGNAFKDMENRAYFDYPQISDKHDINWSTVKRQAGGSMENLIYYRPMNYQGGKFTVSTKMVKSDTDGIVSLYPLKEVTTKENLYEMNMTQGDYVFVDGIPLYGLNSRGGAYYGFDESYGNWELLDTNGDPLAENIASLEYNNMTRKTKLIAGDVEGTAYLRYNIDDDVYPADPMNTEHITYIKNDNIENAVIELNVTEKPFNGTIEVLGSFDGIVNDTQVSLGQVFDTIVRDENECEVKRPVTWIAELAPDRGIAISGDLISFTEPGSYRIKARTSNTYSDWVTILVGEPREATSINITDTTQPSILQRTYDEISPVIVDLDALDVQVYDQYGSPWIITKGEWKCDSPDVQIQGNILITETPGSYQIRYEADGAVSNELTLTVSELPYAVKLNVDGNIPVLNYDNSSKAVFDLSTLSISATDQYGAPISLDSSLFIWEFEKGGHASISGSKITGKITGEDTIVLSYPTIDANKNSIMIKSDKIKVKVTPEYYLDEFYYNEGAPVGTEATAYDLNKIPLIALDQHKQAFTQPEKDKITWSLSRFNECRNVTIDQNNKTLIVTSGTIAKGKTAIVMLDAKCDVTGKTAESISVEFKQKRYLDSITISQSKSLILKNGENAKISDYFTASGKDQYGGSIAVGTLTWYSDDTSVIKIEGQAIEGLKDNKSTTIYAKSGLITSLNKIEVKVEKKAVVSSIEVDGSPGMATVGTTIDLSKFTTRVYNQYSELFTAKELSDYPAKIRWALQKNDTNSTLAGNIVHVGDKEGVILLTATAVNSGTDKNLAEKKIYIAVSKESIPSFSDVHTKDWFYPNVNYMYARNLMRGTKEGKVFAPNANMSRAEAVTMLYRIAKLDPKVKDADLNVSYRGEFKDVTNTKSNEWYTKGLAWATKNNIITGYADKRFGPGDSITREQMCTIMYRYSRQYGYDTNSGSIKLTDFPDGGKVTGFAKDAVLWSIGKKLIIGKGPDGNKIIAPMDFITRAEVATVAQRFIDLNGF